jgi:peroxiredoxin
MMNLSKRLWRIAALIACAIGLAAYGVHQSVAGVELARPIAYTLLNGTQANTGELTGRVVLVNFWAPSCTACLQEMPDLVATHARFKARGYETLAVAMSYDPPGLVADYAESRKLPFQIAIDHDGSLARSFGDVSATPTSMLLNRRGEIVKRYVGRPDFAALNSLIERLLVEP